MGCILSREPSIDRVLINPWPKTPRDMRVVRAGQSGAVGVDKNNNVYCSLFAKKFAYSATSLESRELLEALVELGRLPKEEVERHNKFAKEREDTCTAAYQAMDVLMAHATVKLTARQILRASAAVMRYPDQRYARQMLRQASSVGAPIPKQHLDWALHG